MLSFASRKVFATLKRILTRSIFFTVQFGGTAFKGGVKNPETIQTDTVTVGQGLAHLADNGLAYMFHIFGRHSSQGFDILCNTCKVEDFSIFCHAFQSEDHRRSCVSDFFVALCAHY